MNKVFIEYFKCDSPSFILTGKDALSHALYLVHTGTLCRNADHLYQADFPKMERACSYHNGIKGQRSKDNIEGVGVHAKFYETKNHIIFSSQNNVSSPLFEFAIVFEKRKKLLEFFIDSFNRAKAYSKWWKLNRNY